MRTFAHYPSETHARIPCQAINGCHRAGTAQDGRLHMHRWWYLVPAILLLGCTHPRLLMDYEQPTDARNEKEFYWGQATFLTFNMTDLTYSPAECCQTASDRSKSLEDRREAAALLLAYYVKPGFGAQDMKRVVTDNRWINDCAFSGGALGSGDKPLLLKGLPLELYLFPDAKGHSPWIVYFTLSGGPFYVPDMLSVAKRFLKGDLPQDDPLRITEFVLYYPLPPKDDGSSGTIVERHNYKGVGIKVRPGWAE